MVLSIAERIIIFFADDAWFQENIGDFRENTDCVVFLHGFSVPMKVEESGRLSRLVGQKLCRMGRE